MDMFGQESFAEMLGFEVESPVVEETKKEAKKETKKEAKPKTKAKNGTKKEYQTPVMVYGPGISKEFTALEYGEKVSSDKILSELKKDYPFVACCGIAKQEKGDALILQFEGTPKKAAEDAEPEKITTVNIAGVQMEVGSEPATISKVLESFEHMYGQYSAHFFVKSKDSKVVVPFLPEVETVQEVSLPVAVGFLGETINYTSEDFNGKESIVIKEVLHKYEETYPWLQDVPVGARIHYGYDVDTNHVIFTVMGARGTGQQAKTQYFALPLYVDLRFKRGEPLEFTSADFGGKERVEISDVNEKLGTMFRIFKDTSKDRLSVYYVKECNTLVVDIISSTKGGFPVFTLESQLEEEVSKKTDFIGILHDLATDIRWRIEKTRVGVFRARYKKDGELEQFGTFKFLLPKVPESVYKEIIHSFRLAMPDEAMVQLFWSPKKGYFLYSPEQVANKVAVTIMRNVELEQEATLVMDIHSHNDMPAFFSAQDNRDEVETRLYMVVGRMNAPDGEDVNIRAGMEGSWYPYLNVEDIFDMEPLHPIYKAQDWR